MWYPHLAKNERDAPNFLYADPEDHVCPLFKEGRMKIREPTRLTGNRGCGALGDWLRYRDAGALIPPEVSPFTSTAGFASLLLSK
jgi:hypothetical protein